MSKCKFSCKCFEVVEDVFVDLYNVDCRKKVRIGGIECSINAKDIDGLVIETKSLDPYRLVSFDINNDNAKIMVNHIINKLENLSDYIQIRIGGSVHSFSYFNKLTGMGRESLIKDCLFTPVDDPKVYTSIKVDDSDLTILKDGLVDVFDYDSDDNSDLEDATQDMVDTFIKDGEMFTAFDITKNLRNDGHDVRHFNVKKIVNKIFRDGNMVGYRRTIIDINGKQPFLYHPESANIMEYFE